MSAASASQSSENRLSNLPPPISAFTATANRLSSIYIDNLLRSKKTSPSGRSCMASGGKIIANKPAWPKKIIPADQQNRYRQQMVFCQWRPNRHRNKKEAAREIASTAQTLSAKGSASRIRPPAEVADEIKISLHKVSTACISATRIQHPLQPRLRRLREIVRRGLGQKIRWYTYLSIVPFDDALASIMKKAGCAGIDFTTDSANETMLKIYRQPYTRSDIEKAVQLCRKNGITVMLDIAYRRPRRNARRPQQTQSIS